MKTTATCKTTWTHKLEHKFSAKQLDSRINCMQKKNIWNRQKHTIWRSRLPEVLSTMLGLARTSKITGLSNQGIIKCVPSGYTCHDLFSSTLNENMWNKNFKWKKNSSSCSCCYPSPDSLRTRKNITTTANEWTTERKRQRYLILDADDTIEDYGTMSSLHIVQAVHSSIQSDASYDRQPGQRPHRACRRKLHVAHVVEIHPSNFFSDPAKKKFCLRVSSQISYWLHNDRANGRTSTLRNSTDKSRVVKVLAMPD